MKGLRQLKSGFADPRMKELIDTLWREYYGLYVEKYNRDPEKWLLNAFSPEIDFGQAIGQDHLLEGNRSVAIGQGAVTKAFMELVLGTYNLIPEGQNPEEWNPLDLLFTIANGLDKDNRSNALEVFKSGLVKIYNGLLIGKYEHGVVVPINGMLQYTAEDGLQQWKDGVWADLLIDAPSDGKPYGRENGLWIPIARAPDSGERKTGIDPGYFGQQSITDDYLYTCVQGGLAGEAIWKKSILMHT